MTIIRRWFVDWTNDLGTGGGGTSTFWFEAASSIAVQKGRMQAILDDWADFANASYHANIQPIVDEVEDTTGQIVAQPSSGAPNPTTDGQGLGTQMPNQAQVVAALKTGIFVNGRRLQGRVFFPGLDSSAVLNGQLDPAAFTVLVAGLVARGLVVFSPTYLTSSAVTTAVVGSEIKVLRRRRD